jgi:hypothetical protein
MATQTLSNVKVVFAAENAATPGTAALVGAADAQTMRITSSPGMELKRANILSAELRDDGTQTMPRLGFKTLSGSFNGEVSVGGALDVMYQAIMRATWAAANAITVTGAGAKVSFQVTSTSGVAYVGSSSLLTLGLKVGDVCRFSNMSTVANNDINFRIATIASDGLSFTTYGTPLTVQAADTAATLTILKKLSTATTPVRRSFTIEQYDEDIDMSELYLGCRLVGFKLSGKPGEMVLWESTWEGMDRTILTTGTSPWFTTPAVTTGLALVADDSAISYNGAVAVNVTGFELEFKIAAEGEAVLGTLVTPDVYDNVCVVTGSLMGVRSDLSRAALFDAETEFEVSLLMQEPTAAPQPCAGFFLPRVKIGALSTPFGGTTGAKVETFPLLIGVKGAATGYDQSICNFFSSAA